MYIIYRPSKGQLALKKRLIIFTNLTAELNCLAYVSICFTMIFSMVYNTVTSYTVANLKSIFSRNRGPILSGQLSISVCFYEVYAGQLCDEDGEKYKLTKLTLYLG